VSTFVNPGAWARTMNKRADSIQRSLETIVASTAIRIEGEAARNTPVRTGDLRRGWQHKKMGRYVHEVSNDVEYAAPIEFGFKHWRNGFIPGRHMLGQAVHVHEPMMRRKIQEALRRAIS